MLEKGTINVKL